MKCPGEGYTVFAVYTSEWRFIRMLRRFMVLLMTGMLMAGFFGCKKEGTAEKAGKKIDEAAESARKALDDLKK